MIGQTISHYKILSKLGEGGMGVVYKAEDLTLDRHVALKFLPHELSTNEAAKTRFIREAKAASALEHPNICDIYEIAETSDDHLFMVMPCYEGETLRERLERKALDIDEALDLAVQVASGLAKAHEKGIVHRDVKPGNILITKDGHVKILDFGLAKLATQTRMTKTGTTVGTVVYMSPEQASGEDVDERSDVFSLGVVLYELLTGELPFKGDNEAAVIYSIMNKETETLAKYRSDLPEGAQRVIDNALAKSRDERYSSAKDLLTDLKRLQEGELVAPLVRESVRKSRRRWILNTIVIGLIIILAGYAALSRFVLSRREEPAGLREALSHPAVAVFPFTVRGSDENADLNEGMVDLLSMKLNGAGLLRSVDPRVLLSAVKREVEGSPDPSRAAEIAGHFGAEFYLMGDVFGVGEQLVINASLYEPERGSEAVVHASVEGERRQILELVDSLAIRLIKDRLGDFIDAPIGLGELTTGSYAALKAFLEGEREFRAGRPYMPGGGKAVAAYRRAIEADSTFALAWLRLANASMWWSGGMGMIERAIENTVRYGQRLSARDRLFAQAYCTQWSVVDLCSPRQFYPGESRGSTGREVVGSQPAIEEAERLYRTIVASWPDDFEAWMGLGHLQLYFNWRRGRSMTEARETYERARELDPDSWRVLWRLAWISSVERKYGELEELQGKIYPDGTGMLIGQGAEVIYGLGKEEEKRSIYEELRSASDFELFSSSLSLAAHTEDVPGVKKITRLLTQPQRPDEIRGLGHALLAHQEAARGRWGAAKLEFSKAEVLNPSYTIEHRALMAAMPFLAVPEIDLEAFRQDLIAWDVAALTPGASPLAWLRIHDDLHPVLRTYLLGLLSVRLGETEAAMQRASELEGMFDIPESPRDSTWIQDLAHGLRAQVSWAEGRLEDALAHFEKARFDVLHSQVLRSSFYFQTLERYLRAEVLFGLGRYEEALRWFSSFGWCWGYEYIYEAPSHLRRAQIYERLGQQEEAIEHYAMFVERWADCDEHLQPLVDEAEQRLKSLRRMTADE